MGWGECGFVGEGDLTGKGGKVEQWGAGGGGGYLLQTHSYQLPGRNYVYQMMGRDPKVSLWNGN